jgi:hypothetical protein
MKMSDVEIYDVIVKLNFDHSYSLSAKPIAMLDLMDISVYCPMMKEC